MEKGIRRFFFLTLLFIVFFSFSTDLSRRQGGGFISDGSSYFSIIQSLAYDYDLEYTRQDIIRIKEEFRVGPLGLFLKKGADGKIYFSKSYAYPLCAAPFYRLFGTHGLLLFNGLMLFLSLLMGYRMLMQYHPQKNSFAFALVFVLATAIPVYIWWIQADLFNFFVMFAGLYFFFFPFKNPRWFYVSAAFFSLSVFSKPSNLAPIGIVYLILLYRKHWKRFIILSVISILLCSALLMVNYVQTGEFNFMGGERRTFHGVYPFEKPGNRFEAGFKMTADNYWERFFLSPKIVILNMFYYFFGRFTGIFIYFFPAVFILILFFFQRKIPEDWFVLAAIIVASLVFIILDPTNYFGGSGSVGNRYFLSIFPLFFFLGYRDRIFKYALFPVVIAIIFLSGTYLDSLYQSTFARTAGMSFPIRLFPAEKTQYQTLQSNENPRAFGRLVRDGNRKAWVHFINDNFWPIEENSFWTNGDKTLELFIAIPEQFKEFQVMVKNNPLPNTVTIQIEHQMKKIRLAGDQETTVKFKNLNGLDTKERNVYYVKIKSDQSYCPYFSDPDNEDKRVLGANIHIGFQ